MIFVFYLASTDWLRPTTLKRAIFLLEVYQFISLIQQHTPTLIITNMLRYVMVDLIFQMLSISMLSQMIETCDLYVIAYMIYSFPIAAFFVVTWEHNP